MRRRHVTKGWFLASFASVWVIACGVADTSDAPVSDGGREASDPSERQDSGGRKDALTTVDASRVRDASIVDGEAGTTNGHDGSTADGMTGVDAGSAQDADAGSHDTRDAANDGARDGSSVDVGWIDAGLPPSPQMAKVDFDMLGRPSSEVTEQGFSAWPVESATTISNTFAGVKYTLTKMGSQGTGLTATWSKVAVDAPNYARLAGDGVTVAGGDGGAQIQLTIQGLTPGPHTLLTYHNHASASAGKAVAPVDIRVDGVSVVSKLAQSSGVLANDAAQIAYLQLNAKAGKDVLVLFEVDASSSAEIKNMVINGFELDTPNPRLQSNHPLPADGDEHVDADTGSVTLGWKGASNGVSHDVYVGEDRAALETATRSSPLFKGNQTGTSFLLSGLSSLKTFYWRVDEVNAQNGATRGDVWYFRPRHLAFPGAEGYGRFARGGRGGVVVHVANLNDSGAGSLREAVTGSFGPRTVVFDVGGTISLADRLTISDKNITVVGQTAPGKGILIRSAPFGASGAKDLVMQNIRVRLGGGRTFDGMGLAGCDHCIVDHSSISWTIDEGFSSRNAKNITLQRSLISECLNVAGHQNYPAGTAHGYAATIGGDTGSFHHNLLAHCEGRNWSLGGGLDASGNFAGRLDIFNNVVYNWGHRSTDGGAHEVNFVGNYYKPGAATQIKVALNAQYDNFPGTQRYFFDANVMPGVFDETTQTKGRTVDTNPPSYDPWVTAPFFPSFATLQSAGDAYKSVLSDVGATQPVFDDHDVRIIKETHDGTFTYRGSVSGIAGLPDNEKDVGGYESMPNASRAATWDTDGDGLPDWWETQKGSNPKSAAGDFSDANADKNGDEFTELDDYLQWMAAPHFMLDLSSHVDVDLAKTFAGYASGVKYSASKAVGGNVSVAGQTATFQPTKCGFASWRVSVTDGAGTSSSKEIVAFVSAGGTSSCP